MLPVVVAAVLASCGLDISRPRALVGLPWWWQRDERGRRLDRGAMKEMVAGSWGHGSFKSELDA